jgi:hypothetical protein
VKIILQYAPVNGMPAWEYNVKTSFEVYHNATLFAGVENILDTNTAHFLLELMLGRNIYGDFDTTFKRVFLKIKIPVCKNRNFLL